MPKRARHILQTFPARKLALHERALVAEWLSCAGDVASAYVSERRSDDPAMYRRIVIAAGSNEQPSHLVHAPVDMGCWLSFSYRPYPRLEQFDTLRDALNSIRPVLS